MERNKGEIARRAHEVLCAEFRKGERDLPLRLFHLVQNKKNLSRSPNLSLDPACRGSGWVVDQVLPEKLCERETIKIPSNPGGWNELRWKERGQGFPAC